jgi:T-complex protein 1 subunit beta
LPAGIPRLPPPAEHADFDGIENLALVLGGEITSTFDDPSALKLGSCK